MAGKSEDERRIFFPKMLTEQKILGSGLEIGVFRAWHAKLILDNWPGKRYFGVDPFKDLKYCRDGVCVNYNNFTVHSWESIRKTAQEELKPYGDRAVLLETDSLTASKEFPDNCLDWVYVDGRHHYEGVKEDIEVWVDKIRPGGIMAGHDYYTSRHKKKYVEVEDAVNDHFGDRVNTYDTGPLASWWVQL